MSDYIAGIDQRRVADWTLREICRLWRDGMSYRRIADETGVSRFTVETTVKKLKAYRAQYERDPLWSLPKINGQVVTTRKSREPREVSLQEWAQRHEGRKRARDRMLSARAVAGNDSLAAAVAKLMAEEAAT